MGGDLTGKAIVPITMDGESFSAEFLGERQRGKGEADLEKLEGAIRYNGMYPWRAARRRSARRTATPRSASSCSSK